MTNKIASVTYIPPCWCHGSKWYNAETGEYFDPPTKPVYVCIHSRYCKGYGRTMSKGGQTMNRSARVQEVQGWI